MSDDARTPTLAPGFRLQWESAQNAHVLLYPEGMVKLNLSAAAILQRCDGERSLPALIAELERQFNASNLAGEVNDFLDHAVRSGWVRMQP